MSRNRQRNFNTNQRTEQQMSSEQTQDNNEKETSQNLETNLNTEMPSEAFGGDEPQQAGDVVVEEKQAPAPTEQVIEQPRQQQQQQNKGKQQFQQQVKPVAVNTAAKQVVEVDEGEEAALDRILGDISEAARTNIRQLQYYIREMAPGKIVDPDTGARHQVAFSRILSNIVNNEVENFDVIVRAALKLFEIHAKGVFHMTQVFRFMETNAYTLSKSEHECFIALVNLFSVAGPVKGRELAVKSIDFDKTLRHNLTDEARSRVRAFFKA